MNTNTKILTGHGMRKQLGQLFSCSQPFLRKALNGEQTADSSRALKIRKFALQKGGVELKKAK
jgi:hypothetical protein